MEIIITYLGHACFCLETGGYRTVLDPYHDGMVPGLPPLRVQADAVYCSHEHDDHNYRPAVELSPKSQAAPYTVEELTLPHDGEQGRLRGMNTIRIFHYGGLRVAHLGDVGRLLTAEEQQKLAGVDCLMLPVGGFFTIDSHQARQTVEQLCPRVTIPMHYRTDKTGFPQLERLEQFTGQCTPVRYLQDRLTLDADTPGGVAVLTPKALL